MKVFWAMIAVLVLAGAAVAFRHNILDLVFPVTQTAITLSAGSSQQVHSGAAYDESAFFDGSESKPEKPEVTAAAPPAALAMDKAGWIDPASSVAKPAAAQTEVRTPPVANPALPLKPADAEPVKKEHARSESPEAGGTPAPPSAPPPVPSLAAGDAKIEKQSDGSYLVDGKYTLKGAGTRASPFEVTWDYLVSAQDSYQPRLGKKKLPDRLTLLSGKWVKITGNVAFPVMAQEPTEMLVMLNQWDGCCIGVPPTPYDAVEVKLKEAAAGKDRLVAYGTITGKMTVEPYLVKDWLVSLYAMDEASITRAE